MPPISVPGTAPCPCPGLVPPTGLEVVPGTTQPPSVHALTAAWPACGRCGHPLLEHGEWILDPHAERVRRTKVAIRLDELLEVRAPLTQDEGKLADFAYTDVDLDSLRQQMRSLAYVRQAPNAPRTKAPAPTRTPVLSRSVPNADLFHTLNYLYQRAHYLATCAALTNRPYLARWNAASMRQFFALARRAVIRIDPEIKRSVCKRCMHLLLEGLTAHTSVLETRRTRLVSTRCLHCHYVRARNVPYPPPPPRPRPRHLSQRQRRRRHRWRMHHPEQAPPPPDLAVTPFAERLRGTPWRVPMRAYVRARHGDLGALDDALVTRGDHITTVGLLRNGQLGPPQDAA
ncbi:hypothetical protein MBRA1_003873 [Malassezia brasiliensis]|uniref:Uncharacterized protein n=1 Tax=Malassezia brasiliensis TaxID=1821822 RepID=A0AAF0DXH6_9BASI|nr:hypothetical protein MBRA1_003873 [Malassezia brasiliensis]